MKNPSRKLLIIISAVTGLLAVLYLFFNFAILRVLPRFLYSVFAIVLILGFLGSVYLSVLDYLKKSGEKKIPLPLIINIISAILIIISVWISPVIVENVQYNSTKKIRQEVVEKYQNNELKLNINKITDLPTQYKSASDLGKVYLVKSNYEMILFFKSSNTSDSSSECYIYTTQKPDKDKKIGNAKIKKDYKNNWYYGVYYW